MSLSDPSYFAFLVLVFLSFQVLEPGIPRRVLLLAASYFFYFELSGAYVGVLLLVTMLAYQGALALRSAVPERRRYAIFVFFTLIILAPLLIFKYLSPTLQLFVNHSTDVRLFGFNLSAIVLPVGISFFTFAALGYLIDVYLEVLDPEPDLIKVALFLAFFPLVSAGPIERGGRFMSQFELAGRFNARRAFSALRLILFGLFLKVVLGSILSGPVAQFYEAPDTLAPLYQLCGMIYFSFYLYADFAGYSLIAIGSAGLLGLEARPNFTRPFLSSTVAEFWRNWHISLSSWVRDYLFAPLRMEWRNYGKWGMAGALMVSFVILGAWHGAAWGWIAFGSYHGVLVILSTFTLPVRDRFWARFHVSAALIHIARVLITFLLVTLGFTLWRAASLNEAFVLYHAIFSYELLREIGAVFQWAFFREGALPPFPEITGWSKCWIAIVVVLMGDILVARGITVEKIPPALQILTYNLVIVSIVTNWILLNGHQTFIYYKF